MQSVGTIYKATQGYVLGTGSGLRIYDICVRSGATGSNIYFVDASATSTAGNILFAMQGVANSGYTDSLSEGILFSGACYLFTDLNTTSVTITALKEI